MRKEFFFVVILFVHQWQHVIVNADDGGVLIHQPEKEQEYYPTREGDQEHRTYVENEYDNFVSRSLQQNDDPCIASNTSIASFEAYGVAFLRPSFFSECASSLEVDQENMKQHIENLDLIYKQYHSFYYLAKNPSASLPISYQPELGYSVYGEGGGQVDIEAGLEAILQDVETNGASMATFWDIQMLFNLLYDAHNLVPAERLRFSASNITFVPERFLGADMNATVFTNFTLDEVGNLQLTLGFQQHHKYKNGTENTTLLEEVVETIHGKTVKEFVVEFANNPSFRIPYQHVGGRANDVMRRGAGFRRPFLVIGGPPLDLVPDSFIVTYASGRSEVFFAGIRVRAIFSSWIRTTINADTQLGLVVDREKAESFINRPGDQYDAYARAKGEIYSLTTDHVFLRSAKLGDGENDNLLYAQRIMKDQGNHEIIEEMIPGAAGFTIRGDYCVFKLAGFRFSPLDMIAVYRNVALVAKNNGIKKLIVDISSNGGGRVDCGYALLYLMFPSADRGWFENQWDVNYNVPMASFLNVLTPLVEAVETKLFECPDEEIQNKIYDMTDADFAVLEIAADAMVELCDDSFNPARVNDTDFWCTEAEYLLYNVTSFVISPDPSTYRALVDSLLLTILLFNPWSVVPATIVTPGVVEGRPRTVIRGGVTTYLTTKFSIGSLGDSGERAIARAIGRIDYEFEEIVIVSDGLAGSMGAAFPYMASQLYKNLNQQPKVTLVAYGGTGERSDITTSSFPASVEGVHLEFPIIGKAGLSLLKRLLPNDLPGIDELTDAISVYSETVAIPPFFGDTLPVMPVVNFYDNFMSQGALPLQYVRIPVDEYIPKIFNGVTFEDQSDLEALYRDASNFFSPAPPSIETPSAPSAQSYPPFNPTLLSYPVVPGATSDAPTIPTLIIIQTKAPIPTAPVIQPTAAPTAVQSNTDSPVTIIQTEAPTDSPTSSVPVTIIQTEAPTSTVTDIETTIAPTAVERTTESPVLITPETMFPTPMDTPASPTSCTTRPTGILAVLLLFTIAMHNVLKWF